MSLQGKLLAKNRIPLKLSHGTLVAMPTTIADNAGLDSSELVAQLRAATLKAVTPVRRLQVGGEKTGCKKIGCKKKHDLGASNKN